MSQNYLPSSSTTPPSVATTYTEDTGSAVPAANNLNIFGQQASTVPVVATNASGDTVKIENRAWMTQYVVDPSATTGLRGTFQTIQAALNQAVSDGMAYNAQRVIYVRAGTYNEDLVIPGGAIIVGETISRPVGGAITPTQNSLIVGNHTFTGNAVCAFNNLVFQASSGDIFSNGTAAIILAYFNNCFIANTGLGQTANITVASSYFSFNNCMFLGTGDTTEWTFDTTNSSFVDCIFSQGGNFDLTAATVDFKNCYGIDYMALNASSITAINSTWNMQGTHDYIIEDTANSVGHVLENCYFSGNPSIACISNPTDLVNIQNFILNCGVSADESIPPLYESGQQIFNFSQQGSIIHSVTTASNYDVQHNDYYIGVTDTSVARTINLPEPDVNNLIQQDKLYIIKDESGGAGTNNITVTTVDGTITIDGATSQVINTDYGSMTVRFDGTNYFII